MSHRDGWTPAAAARNYDRRTRLEVLSDPRAQGLDAMTSPSSPEGNRLVADAVLDDITPEPNESTAPPHYDAR